MDYSIKNPVNPHKAPDKSDILSFLEGISTLNREICNILAWHNFHFFKKIYVSSLAKVSNFKTGWRDRPLGVGNSAWKRYTNDVHILFSYLGVKKTANQMNNKRATKAMLEALFLKNREFDKEFEIFDSEKVESLIQLPQKNSLEDKEIDVLNPLIDDAMDIKLINYSLKLMEEGELAKVSKFKECKNLEEYEDLRERVLIEEDKRREEELANKSFFKKKEENLIEEIETLKEGVIKITFDMKNMLEVFDILFIESEVLELDEIPNEKVLEMDKIIKSQFPKMRNLKTIYRRFRNEAKGFPPCKNIPFKELVNTCLLKKRTIKEKERNLREVGGELSKIIREENSVHWRSFLKKLRSEAKAPYLLLCKPGREESKKSVKNEIFRRIEEENNNNAKKVPLDFSRKNLSSLSFYCCVLKKNFTKANKIKESNKKSKENLKHFTEMRKKHEYIKKEIEIKNRFQLLDEGERGTKEKDIWTAEDVKLFLRKEKKTNPPKFILKKKIRNFEIGCSDWSLIEKEKGGDWREKFSEQKLNELRSSSNFLKKYKSTLNGVLFKMNEVKWGDENKGKNDFVRVLTHLKKRGGERGGVIGTHKKIQKNDFGGGETKMETKTKINKKLEKYDIYSIKNVLEDVFSKK